MSITFSEMVGADGMQRIRTKYNQFLDSLNDPTKPQVQIFDPLDKAGVEQIQMVREVSKYLQKKKEEEVNAAEAKRVEEAKAEDAEKPKEQ